jgi:hypothetical protein
VTDFGLATQAQNSGRGDGELVGTPHYLPPERVEGLAEDFRSDIYALGATLFHALAGRPLYDAATPGEIAMKHVNAPVISVLTYAPGVSPSTATVLMKMLRKNPDERHASYEELIAEWQTVKEAVTQRVRNPQPAARLVLENAETQRTQFWFTMAFIGIVLVAGVAFYLMKKDPVAVETAVEAPVAPPFTPLAIAPPLAVIPIVNASFEAPSVDNAPNKFSYLSSFDAGQGAALGWVGEGVVDVGAAVVHNGSPWLYAPAPEGEQCLSLQSVAKIAQTIVFPKQGIYRLTWMAASRQGEDSLAEVQLDGGKVQSWMTKDPVWRSFSARLDVKSAGPHVLSFATKPGSKQRPNSKTAGDTSVAIDQVGLAGPE